MINIFFIWNRIKFIVMNFEGKCEMKKERKKGQRGKKIRGKNNRKKTKLFLLQS